VPQVFNFIFIFFVLLMQRWCCLGLHRAEVLHCMQFNFNLEVNLPQKWYIYIGLHWKQFKTKTWSIKVPLSMNIEYPWRWNPPKSHTSENITHISQDVFTYKHGIMGYQIVPFPMSLSDVQSHFVYIKRFKCNFLYSCHSHWWGQQCRSQSVVSRFL